MTTIEILSWLIVAIVAGLTIAVCVSAWLAERRRSAAYGDYIRRKRP